MRVTIEIDYKEDVEDIEGAVEATYNILQDKLETSDIVERYAIIKAEVI